MGTLGVAGRGERPPGRGCLLLVVAGAASLVTLLLAVPITVLAVLALAPQERGARVTTESGGQRAQAQQGPGAQTPPEMAPETDLSSRLPAAHLIGAWTRGQGLGWEAQKEEAFLRSGAHFSGAAGLALPRDGLYYLYCQVGYRGRAPPAGGAPLRSALLRAGGAYGRGGPEPLLEGAETVGRTHGPAGKPELRPLWYTSVGFGGLVQLRRGERVYVNISHPHLVDYRRGKTFFGAVLVG